MEVNTSMEINEPVEKLVLSVISKINMVYPMSSIGALVNAMGGSIITAEDSTSYRQGMIRKHGNGFQMYLPSGLSEDNEKYFIGRLLGFLFMGMGFRFSPEELKDIFELEEWVASERFPPEEPMSKAMSDNMDYFGHAFFMPKTLFAQKIKQYRGEDIERELNLLVKFFKVSRERVIARAEMLGHLEQV